MILLKEIAELQTAYNRLAVTKKLSKKAICDLVIPFRDKYGLSDKSALMIARSEVSFADVIEIFKNKSEWLDVLRKEGNTEPNPAKNITTPRLKMEE